MTPKSWNQSKTIWVNLIVIALGAASEIGRVVLEAGWIPEGGWVASVLGVINLILRYLTDRPIAKR